jgi:hypothetical protein
MDAAATELLRRSEVTCLSRRLHEELKTENGILELFSYDETTVQIEYFADMFRFLND